MMKESQNGISDLLKNANELAVVLAENLPIFLQYFGEFVDNQKDFQDAILEKSEFLYMVPSDEESEALSEPSEAEDPEDEEAEALKRSQIDHIESTIESAMEHLLLGKKKPSGDPGRPKKAGPDIQYTIKQ